MTQIKLFTPSGEVGVIGERSFVKGRIGYTRTLTRRFFGLGSETRESDETSYIDEVFQVGGGFELAFPNPGDAPVMGLGLMYQHHSLGPGRVESEPTTDVVFPVLFEEGDRHDSLWISGGQYVRFSSGVPRRALRICGETVGTSR